MGDTSKATSSITGETAENRDVRPVFQELSFRPVNLPGATKNVEIIFPDVNRTAPSSVDESAFLFLVRKRISYIMSKELDFDPLKPFPGAHAMGMSLKDAVETYLLARYGEDVFNLNKANFRKSDQKLYIALKNYQSEFGELPFNMGTKYTITRRRFETVAAVGWENASKLDRRAANRLAKKRYPNPQNG